MLRVKVKYFAGLRELLNTKEEEYEVVEGKSLMNLLLEHVPERHRKISKSWKKKMFEDEGDDVKFDIDGTPILRGQYIVLINGRNHNIVSDGLKYELKDGDIIAVLPPVGGG